MSKQVWDTHCMKLMYFNKNEKSLLYCYTRKFRKFINFVLLFFSQTVNLSTERVLYNIIHTIIL